VEVGLEINAEEINILLYRHQNAGLNHDMNIVNRSFENVALFRCLGTTVANQNLVKEEIKRRLNTVIACYHLVQKFCLLVSCLKT
jgi:hypothetical protein